MLVRSGGGANVYSEAVVAAETIVKGVFEVEARLSDEWSVERLQWRLAAQLLLGSFFAKLGGYTIGPC
jgi:hypothetical protein